MEAFINMVIKRVEDFTITYLNNYEMFLVILFLFRHILLSAFYWRRQEKVAQFKMPEHYLNIRYYDFFSNSVQQ